MADLEGAFLLDSRPQLEIRRRWHPVETRGLAAAKSSSRSRPDPGPGSIARAIGASCQRLDCTHGCPKASTPATLVVDSALDTCQFTERQSFIVPNPRAHIVFARCQVKFLNLQANLSPMAFINSGPLMRRGADLAGP